MNSTAPRSSTRRCDASASRSSVTAPAVASTAVARNAATISAVGPDTGGMVPTVRDRCRSSIENRVQGREDYRTRGRSEWNRGSHMMDLVIEVDNEPGALAKVAGAISDAGVNISAATFLGGGERAELHVLVPHAEAA